VHIGIAATAVEVAFRFSVYSPNNDGNDDDDDDDDDDDNNNNNNNNNNSNSKDILLFHIPRDQLRRRLLLYTPVFVL
jgi:hypothetical protein